MTASGEAQQRAERQDSEAKRHAEAALRDLEAQTGDSHSRYYTQGLTNWIPTLAEHVRKLDFALGLCRPRFHEEHEARVAAETRVKVLEEALREIGAHRSFAAVEGTSCDDICAEDMIEIALAAVSSSPTGEDVT